MKKLEIYQTDSGREPFSDWLESLTPAVQAKVMAYVLRLRMGGAKRNLKVIGQGVSELRIHASSGYRVYFGVIGNRIILLLLGGDKGSQKKDIEKAKVYWRSRNA